MSDGEPAYEPENKPNLFWLRSEDTYVIYSTTGFTVEPQFHYQDDQLSLTRTGDQIRLMATEIGEMVTIDVEEVPDLRRVTLTLLLPEILLNDGWVEVPFSTQGILTTHHTSIAGPGLLEGARQTYRRSEERRVGKECRSRWS